MIAIFLPFYLCIRTGRQKRRVRNAVMEKIGEHPEIVAQLLSQLDQFESKKEFRKKKWIKNFIDVL